MKKIIATNIAFLSLILIVGVTHAAGDASEINSCGILSTPGETYLLIEDIDESYPFTHGGNACFVVTANDITLDCQGHTITLQDTSSAWVYMNNRSGVTIKNCVAIDAGELFISYSDNNYLINNTVIGSYGQGIYLHVSSDYNTLTGNTLISNAQSGIFSYSGGHNTLQNNTTISNGEGGIRLLTNSDTIIGNRACYNVGSSYNMKDVNAHWGDATGDDNTCDTTYNFNDAGTTGCTYSCPAPNQHPVADAGDSYSMNEGDTVTLDASNSSDPDDNIVFYEWDLDNDGKYYDATGLTTDVSFEDDGVITVGLKVTDEYDEYDTDTAEITVLNVAPTILSLTAPVDPMQVGTTVETSAAFVDPGVLDTHTVTWSWGDGTTSNGAVDGYNINGSHIYDTPGVYTITLTIEDDDGGMDTVAFQYVVVFDSEGGFVTGGGWINSPTGAYMPDPSLAGKATFGFVSKYQKGANIPTGNTEFQFHVANMNFKSTSYDWLIIAGTKAQYKGTGTINGTGAYKFMLTAIDGTPDKFRIKIWESATGNVIYDNMLGSPDDASPMIAIERGSIVIHKAN